MKTKYEVVYQGTASVKLAGEFVLEVVTDTEKYDTSEEAVQFAGHLFNDPAIVSCDEITEVNIEVIYE